MGVNKDIADPFKRGFTSVPLPSAGLLDLAFFRALHEAKDGGKENIHSCLDDMSSVVARRLVKE